MNIEVRHAPPDRRLPSPTSRRWPDHRSTRTRSPLVGSAANYAHGLIDPIEEIGELAQSRGIGMHVDGCLGGWLLPWVGALGTTSRSGTSASRASPTISADTHSTATASGIERAAVPFRKDLRKNQYFTYPGWLAGGLYLSPGLAAGAAAASSRRRTPRCWRRASRLPARAAEGIMSTATAIKEGIRERVPQLEVIGDPTFSSRSRRPRAATSTSTSSTTRSKRAGLADELVAAAPAGAALLHHPAQHRRGRTAEKFLDALATAVAYAEEHRGEPAQSGAMYGFGHTPQGHATLETVMSWASSTRCTTSAPGA